MDGRGVGEGDAGGGDGVRGEGAGGGVWKKRVKSAFVGLGPSVCFGGLIIIWNS